MKKLVALVYVRDFPTPIPFWKPYTKKFVRAYVAACRAKDIPVRIVWSK